MLCHMTGADFLWRLWSEAKDEVEHALNGSVFNPNTRPVDLASRSFPNEFKWGSRPAESLGWMSRADWAASSLSHFPATVGGVRTARTFATALIHSSPSSCQAAWPTAAGQSGKLWREETLKLPAAAANTLTLRNRAEQKNWK